MIDELPEGWAFADFDDVLTNVTSSELKLPQSEYLRSGSFPVIDQGQLEVGGYTNNSTLLHPGTPPLIVFGDHTKCVKLVRTRFVQGADGIKVLQPAESLLPDFSYWLLKATNLPDKGYSRHFKFLREIEFPLPPLAEQRRIVAKIEELTARSRAARAALAEVPTLLEQFRQSVLASAFRGDLTADWRAKHPHTEPASELLARIRTELDFGRKRGRISRAAVAESEAVDHDEDTLPESWQAVRLRDVLTLQPGYAFSSKYFTAEGIRLLRGTNIVPNGTRWDETVCLPTNKAQEYSDYKLQTGDIVFAMDRPIISTGIKVARLVESDLPALLLQRVGRFRLSSGVDPRFLYAYLQSSLFRQHIDTRETGTQLPHVSGNDIEAAPFILPPLREQVEISRMLDSAMQRIAVVFQAFQQAISDLNHLDQSILAKAFRGELVPQDPADEPASVLLERLRPAQATGSSNGKARR